MKTIPEFSNWNRHIMYVHTKRLKYGLSQFNNKNRNNFKNISCISTMFV